jgi:hypothetical protein
MSDESVVDEGWYIDDICLYSVLYGAIFEEGFEDGVMPPDWYQIQYSGTGQWKVWPYSGPTSYKPPGTGNYFVGADSDTDNTVVFDVELFSPSIDFSSALGVATLDLEHAFEDYVGDGEATICTYSGGSLEETLIYMTEDADDGQQSGGAHFFATFDPLSYADPSDVQLGFWYSTNGGTYAWSYCVDDILVQTAEQGGLIACDGDGDVFDYETHRTCAGNFWKETNTEYLYGVTGDYYGDGTVLLIDNYGGDGLGLNDAIYAEVDLTDPELTYAKLEVAHQWILDAGTDIYMEASLDYDPDDCMGDSDATWIQLYHDGIPETQPGLWADTWPDWDIVGLDVNEFLGQKFYLRFRLTTVGGGMDVSDISGWMVDNEINLVYKKITFVDETPPVTTLVFDDLTGTVSMFAYDPVGPVSSGVCATYYKLDGGSTTEYTAPFTVGEGKHTVEYWSVDCAGNEESHKTSPQLVVDTTAPTVTITAPENGLYLFGSKLISLGNQPFCIGKVTIEANAQDAGTGVTLVTFDVDGDSGYDNSAPYAYTYRGMKFGSATATVTAYDGKGLSAQDSISFMIFSLGLL